MRPSVPSLPRLLGAVAFGVAVAGCQASNSVDSIACTQEARAGIIVEVRDADTQAGLAAIARASATEGLYTDSLRANGSAVALAGVYERAGTYVVDVRAAGYQPFTVTGIKVTKDECHVIPRTVAAPLQKVRS